MLTVSQGVYAGTTNTTNWPNGINAGDGALIVGDADDITIAGAVSMTGDLTIVGDIMLAIQAVSPNTSATTSITSSTLLFYNGATIGTANVVLPASPSDGQVVVIASQPAVTVLALTSDATAINGSTTSLSANTSVKYQYSLTTTDWHKLR